MSHEEFISDIGETITGLVNDSFARLDPEPGRVIPLAPGQTVAHDDCCNGQLWGRVVNVQPSSVGAPKKAGAANKLETCSSPFFAVTVEIGVIRCAAVLDDNGNAPSAAAVTADGVQGLLDMGAILEALKCSGVVRELTSWTPTGPEGGCHGGFWTFMILVSNCVTCEELEVPEEPEEPVDPVDPVDPEEGGGIG